ncbi:DUF916 and DUF3324 domain-containing protein [Periweissella cryptocerci]|nr:DUF916 and DUF3324 domain-containing protein [Periweissella cryptocerci]
MKKWFKLILFIGIFIGAIATSKPAVMASELPFAVKTILPSNQVNKLHTYFDLKVKPGQQQTLRVTLTNDTNRTVVVKPTIGLARTNSAGVVEYKNAKLSMAQNLKIRLDKILTTQSTITIPAKTDKVLNLQLKMPKTKFQGVLAGGITFEEVTKGKASNPTKGMSIVNKYAYVVGVVLREANTPVKSAVTLNKIAANQINYRNVISAQITNQSAKYLNQVKVQTKITKLNSPKVLYNGRLTAGQIAPNSVFDYPTPLNGQSLKPGKYSLDLVMKAGTEKWHFVREFTISGQTASKFNKSDVTIKRDYTQYFIIAGVLLLLIVIYLIYRRLKKQDKKYQAYIAKLEGNQENEA